MGAFVTYWVTNAGGLPHRHRNQRLGGVAEEVDDLHGDDVAAGGGRPAVDSARSHGAGRAGDLTLAVVETILTLAV